MKEYLNYEISMSVCPFYKIDTFLSNYGDEYFGNNFKLNSI